MKHTRRSFLRSYRVAPVEIQQYASGARLPARMNDFCRGGMQLIAEQFFEPGSEIVIRQGSPKDILFDGAISEGCPAEVVWCQRRGEGESKHFLIGVQFVSPLGH